MIKHQNSLKGKLHQLLRKYWRYVGNQIVYLGTESELDRQWLRICWNQEDGMRFIIGYPKGIRTRHGILMFIFLSQFFFHYFLIFVGASWFSLVFLNQAALLVSLSLEVNWCLSMTFCHLRVLQAHKWHHDSWAADEDGFFCNQFSAFQLLLGNISDP